MASMTVNMEDLLNPVIAKLRGEVQRKIREEALKITEEEIAKFAIDLSRFVSIDSFSSEIRITIHKDMKEVESKK